MTIVVNAVSSKVGGAATYVRELARELAARGVRDRFIFFVPPEHAELKQSLPPNLEWHVTPIGHAGDLRRFWWDQVTLRDILRREKADALFSVANFGLLRSPVPQLLQIQNALYTSLLYRERLLARRRLSFRLVFGLRRWLQRLSVERATAVMAPSRAQLNELMTGGFKPRGRAHVNPFGARVGSSAEGRRDVHRPFRLLYPAFYYEHKNLGTLLEAMKRLRQQHGLEVELVTTANPNSPLARGTATAAADCALARDPLLAACVRFLQSRSGEEMAELYSACDLFVWPTLVESFGLPLVEAMACGLPVVASDIPVNRELAGEAALYFSPLDADELAAQVSRLMRDAALRASMSRAAREQARGYTWSAHVDRLLKILEEIRSS
ncbi:MAG TPA: glycosyltransferase family 1 protein [Candidatus Xenobia bacterium]|nr:glycosyltransferase family 1 protein [Candidatus Xenobia bacterium]